jgi:hypothetical protein
LPLDQSEWSVRSFSPHGTELLKLLLYKVTVTKELFPSDWEARKWYWRWLQKSVVSGFHDPMLVFSLDKA